MLSTRVPTILVVEDMDAMRKSVVRCLRHRGHFVLEASSAEDALRLIGLNCAELDLVLTDLALPNMGGVELVAEIRRRSPKVAVAYMTGHVGRSVRYEIAPEEGVPVLVKPFTPTLLESRVREILIRFGWAGSSSPGAHY